MSPAPCHSSSANRQLLLLATLCMWTAAGSRTGTFDRAGHAQSLLPVLQRERIVRYQLQRLIDPTNRLLRLSFEHRYAAQSVIRVGKLHFGFVSDRLKG